MKLNYWTIYALSCEGCIFYVGMSRDIRTRLKCHLLFNTPATSSYINYLLRQHKTIDINFYAKTSNKEAAKECERMLIIYLSSIANKLCNYDYNPVNNRIGVTDGFDNNIPNKIKYKDIIDKANYNWTKNNKIYERIS